MAVQSCYMVELFITKSSFFFFSSSTKLSTFLFFMPKNLNCGFSAIVTWWSGPHKIMSPAFLYGKKAWAVWAPCITGLGYTPDFYLKPCLWAHSYRHGLNPCCPFYDFFIYFFLIYPF